MKPLAHACIKWSVAVVLLSFPLVAFAHPGHDHSDIPSVIRHPFSGWNHMLITATVVVSVGAALVAVARSVRMRRVRWAGAAMVVAGLALLFI